MAERLTPKEAESSAQPEGPRTQKETQEAIERPRRDYAAAAEREINDLKQQREKLQIDLAAERKRAEETHEKRHELQSEISSLNERIATLTTGAGMSQVYTLITSVAMVAGSAMISSDADKGWIFGAGWGFVGLGVIIQMAMAVMSFRTNRGT